MKMFVYSVVVWLEVFSNGVVDDCYWRCFCVVFVVEVLIVEYFDIYCVEVGFVDDGVM